MRLPLQFALLVGALVLLSGTGTAVMFHRMQQANEEQESAFLHASEFARMTDTLSQESQRELNYIHGYLAGTATRDDVEAAREAFREPLVGLRAALTHRDANADEMSRWLDEFERAEAAMLVVSTPSGEASLWDVVARGREADAVVAGAIEHAAEEIETLAATSTGNEHAVVVAARYDLAQARIALFEFGAFARTDLAAAANAGRDASAHLSASAQALRSLADTETTSPDARESYAHVAASLDASQKAAARSISSATSLQIHAAELLGETTIQFALLSDRITTLSRVEAEEHLAAAASFESAARATVIASALVTTAAVIGMGAFTVSRLQRRLRDFDVAASAVAEGRFNAPAPPQRHDDFDVLAAGWTKMTNDLREREHALAERTGVLLQNERMASLGSLLAGVAHEVNNPLAFIKSNEEMSAQDVDDVLNDPAVTLTPSARAVLDSVRKSLIANVEGIARVERINHALKGFASPTRDMREQVDLNDVVEGVLIIAHNRLKHNYRIIRAFEPLPKIEGSAQELGQVVLNLVINAAEASPAGSSILVQTRAEENGVKLTVTDEGPGVKPEMRERLFQRFATSKPRGTGLGLFLSRTIAEGHGGSLRLEPSPKGARFALTLPAIPTARKTEIAIIQESA